MKSRKKLTSAYLSLFCTETAVMFQSGIAPCDGIKLLLTEADKNETVVLQSLSEHLQNGEPLSSALENSGYFPSHIIGVVRTGEKTGRTVEVLKSLADYYNRMSRLAAVIKSAVFFPLILLFVMVGVVIILITQVLPIFNDVFERLGSQMTPLATALMKIGEALSGASVFIILIVCIILLAAVIFRGKIAGILGGRGIFGEVASYHFISIMSMSLESGLDIDEAVSLASAVSGGIKATDKKNARCAELLRGGESLANAMGGSGILNPREAGTLSLGAQGGLTDAVMNEILQRKESSLTDRINKLIGRIEPVIIITISVTVSIILLSVMLPLMGIMNSIG